MITTYYKAIKGTGLQTLEQFRTGAWIVAENPTDEEMESLVSGHGLQSDLLKDAMDFNEVPRVEIEGGVTYIFTRVPFTHGALSAPNSHAERGEKNNDVLTFPVLIIMGQDFLATVSRRPLPFLKNFLAGSIEFYTTQKTKLFLQIFSEINNSYNSFLTNIGRNVRKIAIQLERIENRDIIQFVRFESTLNDFLADLVPTNTLLQNLLSGKFLQLYERDKDLMEDLFLNNGQLIELCKTNLKTIVNIRQAYSAIVTNNLNRIIKLLTALTILLTVPTMIFSFYGMNVPIPFEESPIMFWGILAGTTSIVTILLALFLKKNWL